MKGYIYRCITCNHDFCFSQPDLNKTCPKCNRQLFSTDYTVEEWDRLTDTEKIEIINQYQQVTVSETEAKTNDQSLVTDFDNVKKPSKLKLVPALCTQCGAAVQVYEENDAAICPYCKTPFIIEKAVKQYVINNRTTINKKVEKVDTKITANIVDNRLGFIPIGKHGRELAQQKYDNDRKNLDNEGRKIGLQERELEIQRLELENRNLELKVENQKQYQIRREQLSRFQLFWDDNQWFQTVIIWAMMALVLITGLKGCVAAMH